MICWCFSPNHSKRLFIFKIPHSKEHLPLPLNVYKIGLGIVAMFTFLFNRQSFHSWGTPRHIVSSVRSPVAVSKTVACLNTKAG